MENHGGEETSRKGANESQRIGDWKGCIVRTVVDSDGMAMLGGKGEEGNEPPFSDISQRGIIEAVNVVDILIRGRELKIFGPALEATAVGGKTTGAGMDLIGSMSDSIKLGGGSSRRERRERIFCC